MAWLVKLVREPMTAEERAAFRAQHTVRNARDVAALMAPVAQREPQEVVWAVLLGPNNRVLDVVTCTRGTVTSSLVHPREVFRPAIVAGATKVVLVHNHPSGNVEPSAEDRLITRQLSLAGATVGIDLADHVIVGDDPQSYYSFQEHGLV